MLHSLVTFCCENKQTEQHYSRRKMVSNTQGLDWTWERAESSYGNRGMAVFGHTEWRRGGNRYELSLLPCQKVERRSLVLMKEKRRL